MTSRWFTSWRPLGVAVALTSAAWLLRGAVQHPNAPTPATGAQGRYHLTVTVTNALSPALVFVTDQVSGQVWAWDGKADEWRAFPALPAERNAP